ncbi:MAG TPA: tetratricopeptide repeat protein [Chitinophagaceae bacterium]|nr:tetratricopeptide repeat protein [Chitinophagaceae bacterium]
MRSFPKIFIGVLSGGFLFLSGCNNRDENSPYDQVLSQPPFASLTDSIKKEPKKDELYFRRAILLNKNNFPEPALADFRKAWSLKKEETYAFGISTLLADKKPDSAILFLTNAIKKIPKSVLLQLSLAKAYDKQNEPDSALITCYNILAIDPNQLDALVLKSDLLEKKNIPDESIAALEKACSLAPDILDINYNLAFKYAQNKNPKTLSFCDSLIKKDSAAEHAEPYYFKGVYYSNINDQDKAMSFYNQAIQHDYNFLDAYMDKGELLYDQKKVNNAFKVFQLAATISPTYAQAYYWMGKCQESLGQKTEAKLNYERAYGLDKTFTDAKEAASKIKN